MLSKQRKVAAFGGQMGKYFRVGSVSSLVIRPAAKPQMAITRLLCGKGLPEQTADIPRERAFVISVHLTGACEQGCEVWVDDRYSRVPVWPAGGIGIYDLESNPRTRHPGSIDWVHYHLPRSTLDAFAEDAEIGPIGHLQCPLSTFDHVLHLMTQMILPSLSSPQPLCELSLDHFRLLFCSHVAQCYGNGPKQSRPFRGGLAPWQRRRVLERLRENLGGQIALADLAHDCGLSVSHFARSFKRSFGSPPHRYLMLERIVRAKSFLSHSTSSLSEVALRVGFTDQAAFSHAFAKYVGVPPGQWRRKAIRDSYGEE